MAERGTSSDHLTKRQRAVLRRLLRGPAMRRTKGWSFYDEAQLVHANTASLLFAYGLVRQRKGDRGVDLMVLTDKGIAVAVASKARDYTAPAAPDAPADRDAVPSYWWMKESA
jgi:hypothetical protein